MYRYNHLYIFYVIFDNIHVYIGGCIHVMALLPLPYVAATTRLYIRIRHAFIYAAATATTRGYATTRLASDAEFLKSQPTTQFTWGNNCKADSWEILPARAFFVCILTNTAPSWLAPVRSSRSHLCVRVDGDIPWIYSNAQVRVKMAPCSWVYIRRMRAQVKFVYRHCHATPRELSRYEKLNFSTKSRHWVSYLAVQNPLEVSIEVVNTLLQSLDTRHSMSQYTFDWNQTRHNFNWTSSGFCTARYETHFLDTISIETKLDTKPNSLSRYNLKWILYREIWGGYHS